MNEGFCDLCRPLFRGAAEGGGPRDGNDGFRHVRTMKQRHRHHKSIQDLVECGKTRCLLCAALWDGISRETQRTWLKCKDEILLEVRLEKENDQQRVVIAWTSDGIPWSQATYLEPSHGMSVFCSVMPPELCHLINSARSHMEDTGRRDSHSASP